MEGVTEAPSHPNWNPHSESGMRIRVLGRTWVSEQGLSKQNRWALYMLSSGHVPTLCWPFKVFVIGWDHPCCHYAQYKTWWRGPCLAGLTESELFVWIKVSPRITLWCTWWVQCWALKKTQVGACGDHVIKMGTLWWERQMSVSTMQRQPAGLIDERVVFSNTFCSNESHHLSVLKVSKRLAFIHVKHNWLD